MYHSLTVESPLYSSFLKELPDCPKLLYYTGTVDSTTFNNCISVVGSRKITPYGSRVVKDFVTELIRSGLTIVSGFMYGIDTLSHCVALENGGKTIAVLPCGLNIVCPPENKGLYAKFISTSNLLISEYPSDFKPKQWTFPKRNRIVAGISKSILVIEAGINSGSLITARIGLKLKRKVFVVPGDIYSEGSEGIYSIVREGASIVTKPSEILNYYFGTTQNVSKQLPLLDSISQLIYSILRKNGMSIEALLKESRLSFDEVGPVITQLELQGLISSQGGIYYVI